MSQLLLVYILAQISNVGLGISFLIWGHTGLVREVGLEG